MRPLFIRFLFFASSLVSLHLTCRGELATYTIGNSLTGHLHNPVRLAELSQAQGSNQVALGYHVRSNANLTSFATSPSLLSDFVSSHGPYLASFSSAEWDAVTIAPYLGATIRQEVDAARQLIAALQSNPLNTDARVLVYGVWPAQELGVPYVQQWNATGLTLDSPFSPSALAYELFMQELRITTPQAELIPIGHVYNAIAERIASPAGLPGLSTISNLYGDIIHANNAGGYVANITTYSVLYGQTPVGLGYPSGFLDPNFGAILPPQSVPIVQQLVWDVVVENAVPEPSSFLTMAIPLAMLLRPRRRRLNG